jgi:hypothetical protein
MKICKNCNQAKEVSDFYNHAGYVAGKCKECAKARERARRQEKIEEIRAYDRLRGQFEHRKEANRKRYHLKISTPEGRRKEWDYKIKHGKKTQRERAARNMLSNALRDGKIFRPGNCERCKIQCTPHGHHEDYFKPLEVLWLCVKCHGLRHREINEERRKAGQ